MSRVCNGCCSSIPFPGEGQEKQEWEQRRRAETMYWFKSPTALFRHGEQLYIVGPAPARYGNQTLRGDVAYTAGSIPRGLQFLPCRKPGADISMLLLANVSTQLVTSQPCQRVHPGQPFPPLPRGSSSQCLTCIFLAEIKVH